MPSSDQDTTFEFQHPTIGPILGRLKDGAVHFRGIQYASLRHWFDNSTLSTYDGSGLNALFHGAQTISDPTAVDFEHLAIQKDLPKPTAPGMSATNCLNLNISVPMRPNVSSGFPVFVFIHGGGFSTGANWWPQYDIGRFVQLSCERKKPIIALNINYRLGAPGFMSSEELRQAGYKSNRGLDDQRVALLWVKKYIAGFGGDPAQVTVAGESAGGLSTARLLYTEEPLATRIVVMGGSPPNVSPLDPMTANIAYDKVVEKLNIESLTSEARIKSLEKASNLEIQQGFGVSMPFMPILGAELLPYAESFTLMASDDYKLNNKALEEALIVYSPLDASIFHFMNLLARYADIADGFTKRIRFALQNNPEEGERLLRAYEIIPGLDRQTALIRILQFGSDIGFQMPARALAQRFPGNAFLMEFSEPNPWKGVFKGYSTHILDVAFLFQNYNDHLNTIQRATAIQFADDVFSFVYGNLNWKPFSQANGLSVLRDGQRRYIEGSEARTKCYAELRGVASAVGLDTLLGAWNAFLFSQADTVLPASNTYS